MAIKNIPKYQDFVKLGNECISQSFYLLYKVSREIKGLDLYSGTDDELVKEVWNYNHINQRASLILLYQGVEYLMKGEVCKESPLLLIENKYQHWPSLPTRSDKAYEDLQSISGESLLPVFLASASDDFDSEEFTREFTRIRQFRNKMVHSVTKQTVSTSYLVKSTIKFWSFFGNLYKWKHLLQEFYYKDPLYAMVDEDYENALFSDILDFIEKHIGKPALKGFVKENLSQRRYYCPYCSHWINNLEGEWRLNKWAVLSPNKPKGKFLICIACNKRSEIVRETCIHEECKGNVIDKIYDYSCLTCGEFQY